MQARGGAVQGLDLHLARLRDATRELFDGELDLIGLRRKLRDELTACNGDASLRVTVFAPQFDFRHPERCCAPQALVSLSSPFAAPAVPARVKSYPFQRDPAHIKHVGTFPLFHYRRQARRDGFDDALFVDGAGRVAEGAVWNLGSWKATPWSGRRRRRCAGLPSGCCRRGWRKRGRPGPAVAADRRSGRVQRRFRLQYRRNLAIGGHRWGGFHRFAGIFRAHGRSAQDPALAGNLTWRGLDSTISAAIIAGLPRHPGDWATQETTPWSRFD